MISTAEFVLQKVAPYRHGDSAPPTPRTLCLTDCLLVERDPTSYRPITAQSLREVSACSPLFCKRNLKSGKGWTVLPIQGVFNISLRSSGVHYQISGKLSVFFGALPVVAPFCTLV